MPQFEKPTDEQLHNRYGYHAPSPEQTGRYTKLREAIENLAKTIRDLTPVSPEQTRSFNALDEVHFLANAAIARNESTLPSTGSPSNKS